MPMHNQPPLLIGPPVDVLLTNQWILTFDLYKENKNVEFNLVSMRQP